MRNAGRFLLEIGLVGAVARVGMGSFQRGQPDKERLTRGGGARIIHAHAIGEKPSQLIFYNMFGIGMNFMIRSIARFARATLFAALWACTTVPTFGEIVLVGGFFSNTVDRFDTATGTTSVFSTIAPPATAGVPGPGISGLAYNPFTNRIYASARNTNRIYSLDGFTGAVTGFKQLANGTSPASIAVDSSGFVYVANNAGNTITKFNSDFVEQQTLTLPNFGAGNNLPSGLAFDSQGNLIVSTFAGVGVVKYTVATDSFSIFNSSNPVANGQVAIDGAGNVYVGGAAFSNSVAKFTSAGAASGSIDITAALLPPPSQSFASPNFTSPSGVAVLSNGDVVVAALGRTNPTDVNDNFQNNGGVFLFDSSGTFIRSATNVTPYSSALVFTAVPEPTSFMAASVGLASLAWLRRRRRSASAGNASPDPSE
jgi:uncharacterized protein (TIGR03382 family)